MAGSQNGEVDMIQTMEQRALEAVVAAAQAQAKVKEIQQALNTAGEEMIRALGRADEGVAALVALSDCSDLESYLIENPKFKGSLEEAQHGRLVALESDTEEK